MGAGLLVNVLVRQNAGQNADRGADRNAVSWAEFAKPNMPTAVGLRKLNLNHDAR